MRRVTNFAWGVEIDGGVPIVEGIGGMPADAESAGAAANTQSANTGRTTVAGPRWAKNRLIHR